MNIANDGNSPTKQDALAFAFDIALQQYVTAEGPQADTADTRGRLAARLVVLSNQGLSDEQLATGAVLYLRAFAAAIRVGSAHTQVNTPAPIPTLALGPDGVGAMTQALDACIDDLPEGGVSSTVRQVLHSAILEAVGKGERDSERLKLFALDRLRRRT